MGGNTGVDIRIDELAQLIACTTGFTGRISFDDGKPDGMPRKLLSVDRVRDLGWTASIGLEDGVSKMYEWLLANLDQFRR